jgi:hypothetical protein
VALNTIKQTSIKHQIKLNVNQIGLHQTNNGYFDSKKKNLA